MRRPKLVRRALDAEIQARARARILPDVSPRTPAAPSRFTTPIATVVDAYRQTPESWASVWEDEDQP